MRTFVLPFLVSSGIAFVAAPLLQPRCTCTGRTTSVGHLKQIGLAIRMYSQDWDDRLPPMHDVAIAKEALLPYVKNEAIFRHPGTHEPYLLNPGLSYRRLAFGSGSADRERPVSDEEQKESVAFYEAVPSAENTRAVLFLNGKVRRVSEAEWPRIRDASPLGD